MMDITKRGRNQLASNEVISTQLREEGRKKREADVTESLPVPQHPRKNLAIANR
jgi:hypothetical protein